MAFRFQSCKPLISSGALLALLSITACSTTRDVRKEEPDSTKAAVNELHSMVSALNARLDSMEIKLSSLNDKLEEHQAGNSLSGPKLSGIPHTPANAAGVETTPSTDPSDPEAGFVNDAAITSYRQAMILFQAQKYQEATLAFSTFLERYADHPLAGSAQFQIGECYFRQKEYKLALQEYQRVLTSYDRSSQVPDTLKQMAAIEDIQKKPEEAAKHRQLLLSLFPISPAAKSLKTSTPAATQVDPKAPAKPKISAEPKITAADSKASEELKPGKVQTFPISSAASIEKAQETPQSTLDEPPPTAPVPPEPQAEKQ